MCKMFYLCSALTCFLVFSSESNLCLCLSVCYKQNIKLKADFTTTDYDYEIRGSPGFGLTFDSFEIPEYLRNAECGDRSRARDKWAASGCW